MSSTVTPAPSWLTTFDPNSPGSIASSLNQLLPASVSDPANATTPAGFNILAPASLKPKAAPGPSPFQQALNAFTVTADTFLIQSAINGYEPLVTPAATILAAGQSGSYGSINAFA